MKTNYVGISDGAKSMAHLDQERGVQSVPYKRSLSGP